MTAEQWKPIPGFSDYQVSDLGRVASIRRGGAAILRGGYSGKGYRKVGMTADDGHRRGKKVHQLVAEAFLGPVPDGQEVRHLDDDKSNNTAANLTYGTRSDNVLDSVRNGLHANARKTQCPSGHRYSDDNTYVDRRGRRNCRTCPRERVDRAA